MYNYDLIEKILWKIANLSPNENFDMYHYYRDEWTDNDSRPHCGTSACIAGWAFVLEKGKNCDLKTKQKTLYRDGEIDLFEEGKSLLGFSGSEAYTLFIQIQRDYDDPEGIAIQLLTGMLKNQDKTFSDIAQSMGVSLAADN